MGKSAVIIGGGVGGLFVGAILSKEGVKVTVLEKNATVGGGLQSFTRFGEVFDTGMHVIGGMHKNGSTRRIFEYLGITDKLHIVDVDTRMIDRLYYSEDGGSYSIAGGRDGFVESLAGCFPGQRENLRQYVDALYRIAGQVDLFYLKPPAGRMPDDEFMMSANALVNKYISDSRLRSVVSFFNPFYGGMKDITPAYIHAVISVLYIEGPSRFAGGSYLLAQTLKDYIAGNGGEVYAGDAVTVVTTQGRNITGVRTAAGREYTADHYVCAIHPCTFFSLLDNPSALPLSYRNRLNDIPNSYSAFILNLKLKPETFKYMDYTAYYMATYSDMWEFGEPSGKWPKGFLYMTPPEIEQGLYSTKMTITAPMLWEEVKQWEHTTLGHRTPEYEAWKKQKAEIILDCMEEMHPGFRDCVEAVNTASPLTIRDYYGVKEGSMCGYVKDCNNIIMSQVPVVTKIPNLLLTGQNCNLHGMCGVSLTAINTCEAILGRNFILDKLNADGSR